GRNSTTGVPTGTGSTNGAAGSRPGPHGPIRVGNPTDGPPLPPPGQCEVEKIVPPGPLRVKEREQHLLIRDPTTGPAAPRAAVLAKFWVFTSAHVAAHFTGVIADDYTSEFDPFSPTFGEKFSPANLPISIKDWAGNEISRVYSDQWGAYDGLTYSTWEVNPPNPTGYAPTMMVTCMNDPGPIPGPNGTLIPDPLFNPQYSQFCYEIPFMPGQTQYMDTPVTP